MQPFLSIREATVVRNGRPLLSIDSLSLERGEHVALLGPNGAGKSTFIKLITREVLPLYREEPPVLLMGQARPTLAEVKKRIGVVSSTMQDQMTVHLPALDIVAGGLFGTLGLPRHVQPSDGTYRQAADALARVGVGDLAHRDVMTLSTGQARRVLIARALVCRPEALVLDEPCTGLDPEGMFYVRQCMRTLAQTGTTVVLVTHYPEDIVPEIGRLVLLRDGSVFADGPKGRLLTSETMSELFGVPLRVQQSGDYFSLVSAY